MGQHVLQIRLDDDEYAFLKRCANVTGKSMAQTMLYMADFRRRMQEENTPSTPGITEIQGVQFSDRPFDDYEF